MVRKALALLVAFLLADGFLGKKLEAIEVPSDKCGERARAICGFEMRVAQADRSGHHSAKHQACLQCIKLRIGKLDASNKEGCSLSDVGELCSVPEAGKSREETRACEKQLDSSCKKLTLDGPDCEKCIYKHVQSIDSGLPGLSMCSTFQLQSFCYYSGGSTEGKSDAGVEHLFDKEQQPKIGHFSAASKPASLAARHKGPAQGSRSSAAENGTQKKQARERLVKKIKLMFGAIVLAGIAGLVAGKTAKDHEFAAVGTARKTRSVIVPDEPEV